MKEASCEFTSQLFCKSESKTSDLIEMMKEVQDKFVHKHKDTMDQVHCFEKKQISGDNKTEKNSHYGILR